MNGHAPPTSFAANATVATTVASTSDGKISPPVGSTFAVQKVKPESLSPHQLESSLRCANVGVWAWDLTSNVRIRTTLADALLGLKDLPAHLPLDEFWKRADAVIHPEDRERVLKSLHLALESKQKDYHVEYRVVLAGNNIRHLTKRGQIIWDDGGTALYVFGATSDVTYLKEVEQKHLDAVEKAQFEAEKRAKEAEEYRRRQEEFSSFICHEIRNPLNGIVGALAWVEAVGNKLHTLMPNSPDITAQLTLLNEAKEIISECAKLEQIVVDDVLDFAKLQAGKVELRQVVFNPSKVISNTMTIFSQRLASKGINLVLETSAADKFIEADSFRFKQVLINLISNALKFTTTGHIRITAEFIEPHAKNLLPNAAVVADAKKITTPEYLRCVVEDTGMGMDKKEIARLFNPFQQANSGISHSHGGTGLGLVICKRLVELMGGEINVESQKGKGTKFTFSVRYVPPTPAAVPHSTPLQSMRSLKAGALSGIHVLIVDDSEINRRILSRMLDNTGCSYQTANNGKEAVEKSEKHPFHIILMDVSMPVMDGLTATREILAREKRLGTSAIPIVGLSGNSSADQIRKGKEAGMVEYLTKPYIKEDVLRIIELHAKKTDSKEQHSPLAQTAALVAVAEGSAVVVQTEGSARTAPRTVFLPLTDAANTPPWASAQPLFSDAKSPVSRQTGPLPPPTPITVSPITIELMERDSPAAGSSGSPLSVADAKSGVAAVTPWAPVNKNTCWYSCWGGIANFFVAVRDWDGCSSTSNCYASSKAAPTPTIKPPVP